MPYLGYEQIDCSTTEVQDASDLTIPSGTNRVELQASAAGSINYTMDGTTEPSGTLGMILRATADPKDFINEDVANIKFVKTDGNTKLNVHYYGKAIN